MEPTARKLSFGQRVGESRASKTLLFWSAVAAVVATMVVGFTWGGWVTGGTARAMAQTMADDAVVKRLAPICVVQSGQDPKKVEKLKELTALNGYERGEFLKKLGWSKMPGEAESDSRVSEECAKLLTNSK
jgi:hypothetical protein